MMFSEQPLSASCSAGNRVDPGLAVPAHGMDKKAGISTNPAGRGAVRLRRSGKRHHHHHVPLLFKKKPIEIVTAILPKKPKKGAALKTTLTNGTVTASYDGKIGHHSEHGYHFVAYAPGEPKLLDVLKSGTTLTISVPGENIRVPLKGVAKPMAQFEAACLGKR